MKLNKFFVTLAGLAILFTACNKEPQDENPSMSLSTTALSFAETASSKPVTVTSSKDWKVSGTLPDWVQVSPMDGKAGEVVVTVSVLANDGFERRADVTFNGGTQAKQTLTIWQKGKAKNTSIEDVKDMLTDPSGNTLPDGTIVLGRVVSSRALNDLTSKKSMFIQDETAGINLFFAGDHEFDFGDVITVDVSGLKISKYYEQYQVSGIPLEKASKLSTGVVDPIEVDVKDFLANKYEGMYVTISQDCQVAEADLKKTWVMNNAHTSINIVAKTGETFVVRSSSYSTFGSSTVPQGSGKISGISTIYNDGIQLVFAQSSDYAGLTNDRFEIQTQEITSEKISVILQASQGAKVTLKNATVVATAITNPTTTKNNTFLVTDSEKKDFLLVYDTQAPGIAVGDNVTVAGTLSSYSSAVGNNLQITGADVTIHSHGTYAHPSAEDITATFDSFDPKTKVKLISFKGTYAPNKTYCNVNIAGATKMGSFLTPDGIDVSGFENVPNVKFTGYYLYTTSSTYIYIILTKAEPSSDPYLTVSPETASVEAAVTTASFDIRTNIAWTCSSATDGFTVDTEGGEGDATITVNFSENKSITDDRVATINVVSSLGTKTYTLTQKAAKPAGTVELTFPDDNKENNKVNDYVSNWTAISGENRFTIGNFNNYQWNGWSYIRCGRKNNASVATIATEAALGFAVSKVVITVDKITDATKVNSTKLEVASDAAFTKDVQTVNVKLSAAGDIDYVVPTPVAGRFYRLTFDCASASANGIIQISKVIYKAQ